MVADAFRIQSGLLTATRFPALSRADAQISGAEVATLLLTGAAAAVATGFIHTGLRIPGHSIVLAMIPMALGLALVPRRMAGVIMAGGAFSTASALSVGGLVTYGAGAMTSLCLIGPLMDIAVASTGAGWRLYTGLVAAGVAANLIAFLQRSANKLLGLDPPATTRLFAEWWPQAIVTYTLAGGVAGLLGALFWFQLRRRSATPRGEPSA